MAKQRHYRVVNRKIRTEQKDGVFIPASGKKPVAAALGVVMGVMLALGFLAGLLVGAGARKDTTAGGGA